MSDNIDDYQLLELMNKNLKDEVILLKDENKDLKDQAAYLSAENKKLQDANNELVDKVCDLADKYDELDCANQTRFMREKEEEVGERKRLANLTNQSTVSRLPALQQRAHFSEEKAAGRNTGKNTNRMLSARKFGFQHQPATQGCTIAATTSVPTNNKNVQLPPINTDEKTGPGGGKAKKINSRFEDGVFHSGRKLILPDIDNSTTGLIPKPRSALSDSRRTKPTQDVVTGSRFTPRPPESKTKKSDFVFKRPGSKMAVPRGRRRQQQDTASNSDSSRSTPVLVPRPPARQAKKGPFVFQRPNEKLAMPRSKPAAAQKPAIIVRPAPASTEFVFNRVTSPVAAPRSVPNRDA